MAMMEDEEEEEVEEELNSTSNGALGYGGERGWNEQNTKDGMLKG